MIPRFIQHLFLLVELVLFWVLGLFSFKYHCRLRFELRKIWKTVEKDSVNIDNKIEELEKNFDKYEVTL